MAKPSGKNISHHAVKKTVKRISSDNAVSRVTRKKPKQKLNYEAASELLSDAVDPKTGHKKCRSVRKQSKNCAMGSDNASQPKVLHTGGESGESTDVSDTETVSNSHPLDRSLQRARRQLRKEPSRRTLFVGNLPLNVSQKDLRRLFTHALAKDPVASQSGCRVESVRFRGVVPVTGGTGKLTRKRAVIQRELSSGVSRTLIAYVVLSSSVGIRPALALNGLWLEPKPADSSAPTDTESVTGKHIRVDLAAKRSMENQRTHSVFLGNLPFDVLEEEIRKAFCVFGRISNVRLIRDRETGAVKGFGYLQFTDSTAVALALRASGTISVRNRSIRIKEWRSPKHSKEVATRPKRKVKPVTTLAPITEKKPRKRVNIPLSKLHHTGQAKGITLPSNLRGIQRERFLQKRLLKKSMRQLRRQHQRNSNLPADMSPKVVKTNRSNKKAQT